MFRAILIYLSRAGWAQRLVTGWRFSRRAAARFIAGDALEEALPAVRELNRRGLYVTLDHLGENVGNETEAQRATEEYLEVLHSLEDPGLAATISLKLTQLGLLIDPDLCLENLRRIVERAEDIGTYVRIDMEDSTLVDGTLAIYEALRASGATELGVVIQSYLYRSRVDVERLVSTGAPIRLCKGAYNEPPEVAFPRKADVDRCYDELARIMIDASIKSPSRNRKPGGRRPPRVALATHDEARVQQAREYAMERGLPDTELEFQMLYGIAPSLQESLAAAGFPVRIYVPFGTAWYPYYTRRLAERPANLWFLLSNLFRR